MTICFSYLTDVDIHHNIKQVTILLLLVSGDGVFALYRLLLHDDDTGDELCDISHLCWHTFAI